MDGTFLRVAALLTGVALSFPWPLTGLLTQGSKLAVAAFLLTYGLMPMVIRLAWKVGALDVPDARRVHTQPTPRIGGLAVLLSVNLTLFLNFNYSAELKGVCISAMIVALLSFWDDLKGLPATIKLAGQLLALGVLMASGVHVTFATDAWWGLPLEYLVTALWVIGITNAFNFLDGINGLAASLAAAVCTLMAMLAWHTGQTYMLLICLSVAGAAIGFLPDNARYRQPARSFMGDVGSTYLGWMMAAVAVMGEWSSEGALKAYSAPLLIFSVMIFDMIYTTIARIHRGDVKSLREWVEFVGRDHLHHRLMAFGCTPAQATLVVVALTFLLGLAALAIVKGTIFAVWLLLGQAVVFYLLLTFLMLRQAQRD
ncbi:MAG: MraY family glycosyltransferase [Mariprofundaceae bacterium]|nr:MraY family glycosyltransferase [Mariprofundaceae bacterium]